MKKTALFTALALTVSLFTACGSSNNDSSDSSSKTDKTEKTTAASEAAPETAPTAAGSTSAGDKPSVSIMSGGKLDLISNGDGTEPVIRKLSLSGNRSGSAEFNSKDAATEGIRCVFELNEWIEFFPDTDKTSDIKVYFIKHIDDQNYYAENNCSDETPGYVQEFELQLDEETKSCGSTLLNPDDCEPGLYDMVFAYKGENVAVMLTQFFAMGELEGRSDAELAGLEKDLSA